MLCFKCNEEADAAFAALAQYLGKTKGDLFIEMLDEYTSRCIADDKVLVEKAKSAQSMIMGLVGQSKATNSERQRKKGRPQKAQEAAAEVAV